jgi:hypothetical protein
MPNDMMMGVWIESEEEPLDTAWWAGGDGAYQAGVRSALAPEYRHLPAEEIDELVTGVMESMSPEDAEGLGSFLGKVGRAIAPIAAKVIPVAAPIVGTMIGGPAGAAIGQLAGQAVGGPAPVPVMAQPLPPPLPVAPAVMTPAPVSTVTAPATPTPTVAPAVPPPAPNTGQSAIAQLIALLQSPACLQSLAGQALGPAGAKTVPVGPESLPAPFPAFMNALSVLAGQAAMEAAERYGEAAEEESTSYLRDASGSFLYDPAVAEERAAALLAQLRAGESVYGGANGHPNGSRGDAVGDWFARAGLVQ